MSDATTMWAINIIGTDDLHAVPDKVIGETMPRAELVKWPYGYEEWKSAAEQFRLEGMPEFGAWSDACGMSHARDGFTPQELGEYATSYGATCAAAARAQARCVAHVHGGLRWAQSFCSATGS